MINEKLKGHLEALSISAGSTLNLSNLCIKNGYVPRSVLNQIEEWIKCQVSEIKEIKKFKEKSKNEK